MYVMLQCGLQPRRLLNITHILFSGAATDGSETAFGFYFERNVFYEQKSSRQCFLGRKNISPVKVLCSGACGSDLSSFLKKTAEFEGLFMKY